MKRYKRVLSILLVFCMLISLLPTVALATGTTPITGTCGGNLAWSLDTTTGTFTVTGMGEMHDYFGEIERPWHNYRDSIKSIVISDGVTSVGRSAFRNCEELVSVTLPNTITSVGIDSFYGCENLSGITLPDSVTSIGRNAFSFCAFESFIIPENVESIGAFAFESTNLTSITIPASVIYMGTNPFEQCFSLEEIIVDENSSKYSSIDGVLFDKNKETLVIFPHGKGNLSLVYHIPDGVKTIASHAFYNCIFDSVEIPGSVTTISSSAFHQCIIDEITIPDGVTRIGADAFWNCTDLKRVNIADSVTTIEAGAFDACYYLTDVYYAGSKAMWNNITIHEDNEPLTSATIHYGNTDDDQTLDSDGDGIPDIWEIYGVDTDGDGTIDLPLNEMGADPHTPDIFVEVDWMIQPEKYFLGICIQQEINLAPSESAMRLVYEAFKDHGINLHIDAGPSSIDFVTGKTWGKLSEGNEIPYEQNLEPFPKKRTRKCRKKRNESLSFCGMLVHAA